MRKKKSRIESSLVSTKLWCDENGRKRNLSHRAIFGVHVWCFSAEQVRSRESVTSADARMRKCVKPPSQTGVRENPPPDKNSFPTWAFGGFARFFWGADTPFPNPQVKRMHSNAALHAPCTPPCMLFAMYAGLHQLWARLTWQRCKMKR